MSLPPTSMRAAVGATRPAIMRSAVVLPQPDGPSSATDPPFWIASERSETAQTSS